MCNHENSLLIGTDDGILCRGCGTVFKSFEDIHPQPAEQPEATQEVAEIPAPAEQPEATEKSKKGGRKKA